jgi:pimeloyl-ACP methyl ester carboxylesterase
LAPLERRQAASGEKGVEVPYLTSNGVRLHYQQFGEGADVVLVHALTSNLAVWLGTPLVYSLADQYRVTVYDLRGHGQSEVAPTGYTSADMAQDLAGLLEALEIPRPFLVGHSFGGVVAMHAAALFPQRVASVILSDCYFPGLAHLQPDLGAQPVWLNVKRMFASIGIDLGDTVDFPRLFHAAAALTPEQTAVLKAEVGAVGTRWLAQLPRLAPTSAGLDAFLPAGLDAELLRTIRQPVVALYDEYTPFSATRDWLAENLANVQVETVPRARHLALLESAAEFVELVQHHLRSLCGSVASSSKTCFGAKSAQS